MRQVQSRLPLPAMRTRQCSSGDTHWCVAYSVTVRSLGLAELSLTSSSLDLLLPFSYPSVHAPLQAQHSSEDSRVRVPELTNTFLSERDIKRKFAEILPSAIVWMDLEGIMLSEISQSEKDKYHMISLICET